MITPSDCRAARAALQWTRKKLADEAGVDVGLIIAFELEQSSVSGMAIAALTGALEAARPATVANNINGMLSGAA